MPLFRFCGLAANEVPWSNQQRSNMSDLHKPVTLTVLKSPPYCLEAIPTRPLIRCLTCKLSAGRSCLRPGLAGDVQRWSGQSESFEAGGNFTLSLPGFDGVAISIEGGFLSRDEQPSPGGGLLCEQERVKQILWSLVPARKPDQELLALRTGPRGRRYRNHQNRFILGEVDPAIPSQHRNRPPQRRHGSLAHWAAKNREDLSDAGTTPGESPARRMPRGPKRTGNYHPHDPDPVHVSTGRNPM